MPPAAHCPLPRGPSLSAPRRPQHSPLPVGSRPDPPETGDTSTVDSPGVPQHGHPETPHPALTGHGRPGGEGRRRPHSLPHPLALEIARKLLPRAGDQVASGPSPADNTGQDAGHVPGAHSRQGPPPRPGPRLARPARMQERLPRPPGLSCFECPRPGGSVPAGPLHTPGPRPQAQPSTTPISTTA